MSRLREVRRIKAWSPGAIACLLHPPRENRSDDQARGTLAGGNHRSRVSGVGDGDRPPCVQTSDAKPTYRWTPNRRIAGQTIVLGVLAPVALRRVREGEKRSEVVKSLGLNRTSIYRWLKAACGHGKGNARWPRGGQPVDRPSSQRASKRRRYAGSTGKDPRQFGLDFGLWTRQIVATLIDQKFGWG